MIRTQISDTQAESLLHDLVAIESFSGEEHDAVSHLVDWMQANGYDDAYVDEAGSGVGIIGSGTREVVLLGHIDTFGGAPSVEIRDRTLYGRGSVDAKGPLCTFAVAAAQAQIPSDWRVVVIGAVEEEASSSKGARHALTQFAPDACIIGEPSRWDRITVGYKGRLVIDWRWYGALAHSASGVASPAEHAFAYWQRVLQYVETLNQGVEGAFHRLDATIQSLNTGQEGAYGFAEMTLGFRLPPSVEPQSLADALTPDDDATIRTYGMENAVASDRNSDLSRVFRGAIRANDGTPRFVHKTGTSDMNVVAPAWNCPILAYGPGDSSLDHTPDEHIDLDEYLRAIRVLTDVLERL